MRRHPYYGPSVYYLRVTGKLPVKLFILGGIGMLQLHCCFDEKKKCFFKYDIGLGTLPHLEVSFHLDWKNFHEKSTLVFTIFLTVQKKIFISNRCLPIMQPCFHLFQIFSIFSLQICLYIIFIVFQMLYFSSYFQYKIKVTVTSLCPSLWFTHLPAFATTQHHKARFLQLAFKILTNMQKLNLSQADEVNGETGSRKRLMSQRERERAFVCEKE